MAEADATEPSASGPGQQTQQEHASLREDMRVLARDAKHLAQAELALQKARAAYVAGSSKVIALLGLGVIMMVLFSLMALVVGLVIALGPALTPWGAMAAVTLALLAIATMLWLAANLRLKRMKEVISDRSDDADKR